MAVCSGRLSAKADDVSRLEKKCFNNISPLPNTEAQWSNKLSRDTMGYHDGVTKSAMLISVGGSNDRLAVMEEQLSLCPTHSRTAHSSGYTAVDVWCDFACWFAVEQTMGGSPQMWLSTTAVATARLSLRPLVYSSFTTNTSVLQYFYRGVVGLYSFSRKKLNEIIVQIRKQGFKLSETGTRMKSKPTALTVPRLC